jgi:NAD(P) transhydrogenase subunit alpha
MAVTLGVMRETAPNERRVAMTPDVAKKLKAAGLEVLVAAGAGEQAGVDDAALSPFAGIVSDNDAVLARADLVFAVQPPSSGQIAQLREGAVWIGLLAPHADPDRVRALRDRKITAFAMELLPRTTRAQAMDVLSSQAGMAGYKAVLIAAQASPKFFPMLTTAAGTIRPAKVLVIGAGVAGLQAIATARRLGAQVEGFDVRPEVREQIQSLGAKFLDLGVTAAGAGGYARELTAEERAEQQRRLAEHVKGVDVIVTTAAVPGRPAPKIITRAMVEGMRRGAVIVDLAAETGGNCEVTRAGETVDVGGVAVIGPVNLPSMGAQHASEMYAKNLHNFAALLLKDGAIAIDFDDDLVAGTCLTHAGTIRHEPTRKLIEGAS